MRLRSFAFAVLLSGVGGCSSDAAPEFPDPDLPGRSMNPDGVPYPTDSIGSMERASSRPGSRIPNLTFQAYVDGDRTKGLQTVSLADFYDPAQKRHKLLDIQVSAVWCLICSAETSATVEVKEQLASEGAVFLQVMISGNTAAHGPSLEEADGWVDRHAMSYTLAIDVRGRRLSGLGVGTVPYDILVDTRTMEILDSSAGAPADITRYVRDGLAWVRTHPPSY